MLVCLKLYAHQFWFFDSEICILSKLGSAKILFNLVLCVLVPHFGQGLYRCRQRNAKVKSIVLIASNRHYFAENSAGEIYEGYNYTRSHHY